MSTHRYDRKEMLYTDVHSPKDNPARVPPDLTISAYNVIFSPYFHTNVYLGINLSKTRRSKCMSTHRCDRKEMLYTDVHSLKDNPARAKQL
jgi:porphobilinogen deaminase